MIDRNSISCPLCQGKLGTIEIDGFKKDKTEFDCHCCNCNIWFNIKEVSNEEKQEMFDWC
jgi:uncharacterized protein YbaR (Trm112 family)